MAINPGVDDLVTAEAAAAPAAPNGGHAWPQVEEAEVAGGAAPIVTLEPPDAPAEPPAEAPAEPAPVAAAKARPRWIVPAAIAVVGLIVSGMLGYFLYATIQQRDGTRRALASTQATLASTQQQLSAAQADAASRKRTADYLSLYVTDSSKVQTDYASISACTDYSSCRTAAQQLLTDMQTFQKDRSSYNVPDAQTNSDSALGDSLSAGIAGVQELITGMDNDDLAKIKDGSHKVDAAILNLDKAEQSLGASLS